MTLARLAPLLKQAQTEGYALGAFNINTLEQAQAIVLAAQEEQAPVILQVSHNALLYLGNGSAILGLRYISAIAQVAASSVDVPVVFHLDHGTYSDVVGAVALGFTSVMFDGGDLSFAENIQKTQELRRITRDASVSLEAELGETPKPGGSASEEEGELTDPEIVAEFIAQTNIDSLAIAVGSSHGETSKSTRIDRDLLCKISEIARIPIVLHGSSGVVDEDIQFAIQHGVCKVNVATQLNKAFSSAIAGHINQTPDTVDPRHYLRDARSAMIDAVRERLQFIGASGQA